MRSAVRKTSKAQKRREEEAKLAGAVSAVLAKPFEPEGEESDDDECGKCGPRWDSYNANSRSSVYQHPYLFPALIPDVLLAQSYTPKYLLMTREFDHFRVDAEMFASRLHEKEKLLDFYVEPGTSHYNKLKWKLLNQVLEKYL